MTRIKALIVAYKELNILGKVAVIVNCLFAGFLIISYLSAITDPQKFWLIAFFGLSYQLLLFINILFLIYWAFQFRVFIFISAIAIVLGWGILINNVGLHFRKPPPAIKAEGNIRVMTYNVHNFMSIDSVGVTEYKRILNLLAKQQPDIISFEEFNSDVHKFRICDSLKKVLKAKNYYFQPLIKTDRDSTGIAIFSKYPIVNYKDIPISSDSNGGQCIYIDVKSKNKIFRIYCVHLQSIEFDPEDYTCLADMFHFRRFSYTDFKHLLYKMKIAYEKRSDQVQNFRDKAEKCPYPYIVSGDFNDTPSSWSYNKMSEGLNNSFRERGCGVGKTFNGNIPKFQIDYILASKQFKIHNYAAIHSEISDHYPVCVDVSLN